MTATSRLWQGIVLDLDDTIFDTSRILLPSADRRAAAALRNAGLDADEDSIVADVAILRRQGVAEPFRALARENGLPVSAAAAAEEAFFSYEVPPIRLEDDVAATLRDLATIAPLALLTAGSPETQRRKADLLGLERHFSTLAFVDFRTPGGKTDALASLTDRAGWRRDRVAFAGDRLDGDVRAANRCGCLAVWVRRDGAEFAAQVPSGPDDTPWRTISHVRHLPGVLRAEL